MSRARHKRHHAAGGSVYYAGGGSNVEKEAEAKSATPGKKRGGRHMGEGEEAKHHAGKRARGGGVHAKVKRHSMHHSHTEHDHNRARGGAVHAHGKHHVHHHHAKGGSVEVHHHHRARGGAVGSDKRPLSSAANVKFMPEEKGGGKGAGAANEQTSH